jgi:hypothetical protein
MLSFKRTPLKLGLTNSPICKRCLEKGESATHILCDCKATAYLRLCYMGHYFVKPLDCHDVCKRYSELHSKCAIEKGMKQKGKHNRSWRSQCKGWMNLDPPLTCSNIHTWHCIAEDRTLLNHCCENLKSSGLQKTVVNSWLADQLLTSVTNIF